MYTQTAGFLNILTASQCVYTVDEVLLGVSRAGSEFPHPYPPKRSSSSRSFSKDKYFFLHFVSFVEKKPTCISLICFFFHSFSKRFSLQTSHCEISNIPIWSWFMFRFFLCHFLSPPNYICLLCFTDNGFGFLKKSFDSCTCIYVCGSERVCVCELVCAR